MANTLVISTPSRERAPWAAGLPSVREIHAGDGSDALDGVIDHAECALVDAPPAEALDIARRVHAADATLQTLLVVPDASRQELERMLVFAPGLGEVWTVAPQEVDAGLIERASEVTRTRRSYRGTRQRAREKLAGVEWRRHPGVLISDSYLAALLHVLPDAVLSIDADGRILSWNPAAESLAGRPVRRAVGSTVGEVLRSLPPDALPEILERGRGGPATGEVSLAIRGETRRVEVRVVPVAAGDHQVRSVVLRDVTDERHTQAELELQAARLQEQAVELEELNAELRERSAALEAALATRSRFYAAMSHELRTPLNAIIGYNELLLERVYGALEPAQEESIRKAQRAAKHLLELVDDVLDLARIEAGRIDIVVEETRFPDILADLLDTVRPMAAERHTELRLRDAGTAHTIRTDPRRMRQILLNLLSNAIKFGEGEPVEVRWAPGATGGVTVEVADRGRGIPPEDIERIFEEFVQVRPGEKRGSGLGLPVSRRLAEYLGGDLRAESTPGEGSVFRLTLPAEPPDR